MKNAEIATSKPTRAYVSLALAAAILPLSPPDEDQAIPPVTRKNKERMIAIIIIHEIPTLIALDNVSNPPVGKFAPAGGSIDLFPGKVSAK